MDKTDVMFNVISEGLKGRVQLGDVIAVASKRHLKGSNKCIYDFFDVAKVLLIQDLSFTVNVFSRQPNAPTFHNSATEKTISVSHSSLRYIISDACITADSRVRLDSLTLENIVKCCFNGV